MGITIDAGNFFIPTKKGRKIGSGKSMEYQYGSLIYKEVEVGKSVFVSGLSRACILIRLNRLNGINKTSREYTTTAENNGFRILRIK